MLLALALLFAAPASASHVQCGDVITQDTTLDNDLACGDRGLGIEGDNVTLDLGGHTIGGPGGGVGMSVFRDHIQIVNGTIAGFGRGVEVDGPRGTTLRHVALERNGTGLHCQYAPECHIEDSLLRHNSVGVRAASADGGDPAPMVVRRNAISDNDTGVFITGEAGLITDNRIERNAFFGVMNDYGHPVRIARNVVTTNGSDGVNIFFGADATIVGNHISRNTRNGVAVYGAGASYEHTVAIVEGNRIERNGRDGVLVENWEVTATVQRNDTSRNGDDGIDVDFGAFTPDPDCCFNATVTANKAFFNGDLGIEAAQGTSTGTTDGGGNKAKHNGNPAQCVGVSCK